MTAVLEGGEWPAARPGRTLPPGKTRYPFYRRPGRPQGRSGRVKILVPTGIRSRTVQSVVSRYTDLATGLTKETAYITTIFKHTNLKIAYSTNNSMKENRKPKSRTTNKFLASGVWKLTCSECVKANVGQRGKNITKIYKELLRTFRNNSKSHKFAQHLNGHITCLDL